MTAVALRGSGRKPGGGSVEGMFFGVDDDMKITRLPFAAAGVAAALAFPLTAFAAASLTYSVSPTTHGAVSTASSTTVTSAKTLSSSITVLASGETVCEASQTCSPPNGTTIGSAVVTAKWSFLFCGSAQETFNIKWVTPVNTKTYTLPSGETAVAQVNITNSLANIDGYVLKDSSSIYDVWVPSYPNLTCSNTSATIATTIDGSVTVSGTVYNIHTNPSSTGSHTVTETLTYSDNSTDNLSASYSTT
jgi:hypothetical protein